MNYTMIKRFFILLLAIVASVGMMNAKVTWNSSNISDLRVQETYQSYSKEGVTLRANADMIDASWYGYGDHSGIEFHANATGGFTFSNTLGKNFTKIEMFANGPAGWDFTNLGSGWSFYWDYDNNLSTVTWTGNAATVDLLKEVSNFGGEQVKSIVFYFVGDSEAPDPTYTVALKAGTANADKVTLSATSVVAGATVTVTPDDEYEITAFSAYYVVVEDQLGSIYDIDATLNAETGAYSFTMPAANVTIEATIALKPVPEGDIYAGFTATAGSGGFDNEGSANLVDNKFISSDWTKWCTNDGHKSVPTGESESCWWIDFEASAALNPTGYILTTGNDTGSEHGRNPKNWVLKAKLNAGDAWTTIATVTNDVTMKNQSFKDYKFFVDQSGSYKYFRFEVFANQGASVMQLCQLRLIGTDTPAAPAWVRDGDTWDESTKTLTVNSNTSDNAYASKHDIKHLIVSDAVTELGWGTFFFDSLMTTVELGNNLEIIGISAFNECRSLSTITVPASVTNIKVRAFQDCRSLTTFICEAVTPPTIGNAIFQNDNNLTAIYVPAASVDAYKSAWSDYASLIKAIGGGSAPTYTVALKAGTANADKVTLSATSAIEGATVTVTPNEDYEITEFSAYYVVVEDQLGSIYEIDATLNAETGAYSFTMPAYDVTIEATIAEKAAPATAGALNGAFTINADGDKIVFSKGNLQATTTDLGANWTWDFAPNQWSLIGNAVANNAINGNKKVSANGTVDLFGWSTAATYYGINESWKNDDYAGDFVDWGALMGTEWRTLSRAEFYYIVYSRTDAYKKRGQATVNGVPGYVLLPDAWTLPSGLSFTNSVENFTTNQYDGADWTAMESAGAVFLPAAGVREGSDIYQVNIYGWYWASTPNEEDGGKAYYLYFDKSSQGVTEYHRWKSKSVRLVTEAPIPAYEAAIKLINAIGTVELTAECKAKIDAARAAYDALSDGDKDLVTNIATLTTAEAAYTALNQVEADKIIAKINNIPTTVELKLATRDSIESARAAYDALTADQQALVTNYQKLTDAEDALAALNPGVPPATPLDSAQAVKDLIEAIPAEITLEDACVNAVQAARDAYNALSDAAKGALDAATGQKLNQAITDYTALIQAEADKVIAKINNIPTTIELKLATRDSINNARAAYDALNAAQQALVSNIDVLTNAEAALAALNPGVPPATPLDSAQAVKDLIDAIPTPVEYPTSGPAIAAALVAYQQLSDAAKGALDDADVQKMTDAATQYAALDAIAAIEAIPTEIVYDPAVKAAIESAREKYDALIDASKALVDDEVVAKLTNAEKAWADLVALIEHNVSYIGKDGELKNEKVALLHIPNPAPDFNGYEFVRWDVKAGDFLEEGLRVKAVYTPIITTNPAAIENLMYNGTAQTLITAGVAKEGHIEYRINDGDWSAELPKATNAAAYVVYYKLVREGHDDYIADPINVTIAKAPVTYTAPTAVENLVYTASNQTLIAAGQTNDGTFEYSLDPTLLDSWKPALPQAKDAGTYSVYYRVQGDLNHLDSVAATPVAVTIAKAALTATADDKNVIYGDAVPAYTVTYAGWQGNDDASVLTGNLAFACDYAPTSNVGEYTITPSGVNAANYTITFVNGKVTVAQALLTVTAENKTVTYGDAVPTYTATYSGWKNTDGASVVSGLVYTCEYAPTSNVGDYTITPSGATATNYSFAYVNGKVTVNKAALMITAEDKNVTYGDAVPEYTATYSGWKNADDASVVSGLVYTCAYAPTSNVDEYAITPSGAAATNYAISYTNGKVTVAQAPLMITADDKNVIYGDAVPTYTATYSGWKNEDNESVVSNLAYTCEYAPTSNVGELLTTRSATPTVR